MRLFFFLFLGILPAFSTQKIKLCDVPKAETPLISVDQSYLLKTLYGPFVEAHGNSDKKLIPTNIHPFIYAAHKAFADHRPLTISPDNIWLLISQGVLTHLSQNSDKFREYSKSLTGSNQLIFDDPLYAPGKDNEWLKVVDLFSEKLSNRVNPQLKPFYEPSFSTTDINIKNALKISQLTAHSEQFEFALFSLCGIPEIIVEGTPEDWKLIASKMGQLETIGMAEWASYLKPVIDEFIKASKGESNPAFWNSFYKFDNECGNDQVTGWILNFFPYNNKGGMRQMVHFDPNGTMKPLPDSNPNTSFPSGRNYLPFKWRVDGRQIDMRFESGFMGVSQDSETLALKAEINWAVVQSKASGQLAVWQQNVVRDTAINSKILGAAYSATFIDIDSFKNDAESGLKNLTVLEYAIIKKPVKGAFLKDLTALPHFKSLECRDWNFEDQYLPLVSRLKNEQFAFVSEVKSHFFQFLPATARELVFSETRVKSDYFKNIRSGSIEKLVFNNCTFEDDALLSIASLKKSVQNIEFIKCQNLSYEQIDQLNQLTNLKSLTLKSSKLSDLPPLKLADLEYLDLSSNMLQSKESLNELKKLKVLILAGNRLNGVLTVDQFPELRELILHHNYITHLDVKLDQLEKLNISHNRLVKSPGLIKCRLSELHMEKNRIDKAEFPEFLHQSLRVLSLEEVRLSKNDIKSISSMRELHSLSLKNCALQNSDILELGKLNQLQTLRLWTNRQLDDNCKDVIIKLFSGGTQISIFDCGFSSSAMDEFARLREKFKVN